MLTEERKLSRLLGMVYDAASDPTLWAPFLEELAGRSDATSGALVVQAYDQNLYSLSNSWRLPEEMVRAYEEYYHSLDAWAEVVVPNPDKYPGGSVWTSQSICPLPLLKKTEFYNDNLVSGGIEHALIALLENSQSCVAAVVLYRDKSHTEFTDSDLKIFQILSPHLQRAFGLHAKFSALKSRKDGIETAFDALPTGVIFFDCKGEIILMNRSAAALVVEKDGLLATRDGLRAEEPTQSALLTSTIQQAASTSNGNSLSAGRTVFVSRRTRPSLQVVISPIHDSMIATSRRIAAVAFINDPLCRQRPAEAILRMLYGLTPAECRVALLLSDGHSPRDIANTVGVTEKHGSDTGTLARSEECARQCPRTAAAGKASLPGPDLHRTRTTPRSRVADRRT
jgi:hypothetical protein